MSDDIYGRAPGPWKNYGDITGSKLFNYDDLMKGTYSFDDLYNGVYGGGGMGPSGGADQGRISPDGWNNEYGVLNGLGTVTGSNWGINEQLYGPGSDGSPGSPWGSYVSDPNTLFIDNRQNGSNTEGSNWNYNITRNPDGTAKVDKVKRYEDQMDSGGWEVLRNTAIAASLLYGGAAALGGEGIGAAGAGGAAEAGGGLTGGGSAVGGGFGGYGGAAMETGAFDLGGTFGGVEGAGGYSSGLADLFGSGGSYLGDLGGGAFDMGGTYGGAEGAGGYTGDYFGSGLLGDFGGTGAFDQTVSQGAGLGFGGSDSSYGLSNLYSDARTYGGQLNDLNNVTQKYTGQSVSQLGRGLYDLYAKNKISNSAGDRADQLQNLFSNDSPYAQQLAKQLAIRDSAAGRNSQYGPRSVELQAKLAEMQANVLNSKNYNDLRNTQTNSKLGMFNSLVANSAANMIAKNTPALVSSALSSVSKFIGF